MMSTLADKAKLVSSRAELVDLVRELKKDLQRNPDQWVNADLPSFLEALAAWVEDMDGFYVNQGRPVPALPDWGTLADMLMGGRCYE
jgi:hypothetical protein